MWFFLALANAFSHSLYNAFSNHVVSLGRYSKFTIVFWASLIASLTLFITVYFVGIPEIDNKFWAAVSITALINAVNGPLLLKAYELGEFSTVFSMTLLTPVFLVFTSSFFLNETPSFLGIVGGCLTVFGLWLAANNKAGNLQKKASNRRGNLLGIFVALGWSISLNFDKLAAQYSSAFFAPAVVLAVIAGLNGLYLLLRENGSRSIVNNPISWRFFDYQILILLGLVLAGSNILNSSALLAGLVFYVIAIKRISVLLGVFWGWLFFHEQHLRKKLLGAAIAVIGVAVILLA